MNTQNTGNTPEKKYRAGSISATVWSNKGQNKTGEAVEFKTISLSRCYRDEKGDWQNTASLRIGDLPKAGVVLQKAYEYLILNEQELFKAQ
tara:strand:+ start:1556 stop:1828 length:273 start_codon:yes stop_codon:yes gene_type:complete